MCRDPLANFNRGNCYMANCYIVAKTQGLAVRLKPLAGFASVRAGVPGPVRGQQCRTFDNSLTFGLHGRAYASPLDAVAPFGLRNQGPGVWRALVLANPRNLLSCPSL
jgi:hypothetical protein